METIRLIEELKEVSLEQARDNEDGWLAWG